MDLLGGLNQDQLYANQPLSTYRWALNWVVNLKEGTLQSEPGFDFQFKLRNNLQPIGMVELADGVVIFSTNPDGTDCEIGLFTETPKTQWALDATTTIDYPANTYIPVLNNSIVTILNGTATETGLNFSPLHQIQGVYRYNNIRELEVAFTDWFNIPRVFYLGDYNTLVRYYQPYSAGNLDIFQRFTVANVDRKITASGAIPSGTYFLFYRYQNADLSTTQTVVVDRPIYITSFNDDRPGNTWGDAIMATPTSKGIAVNFKDLDISFPNIQIGLFRVNDNKAVIITSQSINGPILPEVVLKAFQGDGTFGSGDLAGGNLNVLVQQIRYIRAKTVATQGSRLYFGNLIGNDSTQLGISQKYVNSSKMQWVLDIIDTTSEVLPNGKENNIKSYNNYYDQNFTKSFQAGEVYAFFCRARLKDGTLSPWFHVPGNEPTNFDMLIVPPTLTSAPYAINVAQDANINDLPIITEGVDEFTMDKEISGGDPLAKVYQLRDTVSYNTTVAFNAFSSQPNEFGYWENQGESYDQYFLNEDLDVIDATAYASGVVTKRLTGNVKHFRFPSNYWINNAYHLNNNTLFYDRDMTFRNHALNPTHDLFVTKIPRLGIKFTPPFLPPDIQDTVDYWELGYAGRDGQNCTVIGQDLSLFATASSKNDGNSAAVIQDIEGVAKGLYTHNREFDLSNKFPSGVFYSDGTPLTGYAWTNNIDSQSTYNATYYGDDPADQTFDINGNPGYILEADGGIPKLPKAQMIVHPDVVDIGTDSGFSIDYVSYEVFLGERVVNPNATANNPGLTTLGKRPDLGISYVYPPFMLPDIPTDGSVTSITTVKSLADPSKTIDLKYDDYPGRGVLIKNNPEYINHVSPTYGIESFSDTSLSSITLNRKVAGSPVNIDLDSSTTVAQFIPGYPDLQVTSGNPIEGYQVDTQVKIPSSQVYKLSFDTPVTIDRFPYVSGPLGGRSAQHYGGVSTFTTDISFNPNNFSDAADFLSHMDRPPATAAQPINGRIYPLITDDTLLGNRFTNGHSFSQNGIGNHSRKDMICTYRRYTNNVYSGLFNSLGIIKAGETNKEDVIYFGDVFLNKVNYKFRGMARSNDTELTVQTTISGSRLGASFVTGITTPYFFAYTVGEGTFKKVSFRNTVQVTEFNFFGTTRKNLAYRDLANYNLGYPDCNKSNINYDIQNSFFPKTETSIKTLDSAALAGKYPFRLIFGQEQGTDAKVNNWRQFLSTDLYEMDKVKGEIVNLQGYDEQLLIHTEKALWITRPVSRLALANGSNYEAILGTGSLFDPTPNEISPTPLGMGGTVHQFSCKLSKLGYSFVDANTGRFYLYRKDFNGIGNLGDLGMYQFLQTYANIGRNDFSNSRAAGISAFCSWYDPHLKRLVFGYNQVSEAVDTTPNGDYERSKEAGFQPYTLSISEVENEKLAFTSFHDYHPTLATSTMFNVYSFDGQNFYRHNSPNTINNFYDNTIFNSVIDIVFNTTKIRTQDGGTVEGAKNAFKEFQNFKWLTEIGLLGPNPPSSQERQRYLETFDFATVYNAVQLSERVALVPFQTTRVFDGYWNFNAFRDNLQRNSYPSANKFEDFPKFIGDPITGYSLDYTKLDPTKPYNKRFVNTYSILRLEANPLYTPQGGSPQPIKQISIIDIDSLNKTVTK